MNSQPPDNLLRSSWSPGEASDLNDLPRRLHQVLVCLMDGDSEKQVAQRLNISPHTVHDYVKQLHTRFDVSSRGELLSRCWSRRRGRQMQDSRTAP